MSRLGTGGRIDRDKPLRFSFDGKSYTGFAGDTLASALIANDVTTVGRSFKYHRRRGVFTAGSEEPNAVVSLRKGARFEPNTRATMAELFDGLDAAPQNVMPSLSFDVMAVNQLLSRFIGAGFYYKTFMWPAAFWEKLYEPIVRGSAGIGTTPTEPDPDTYEKASAFCDVLVIGAGPAGLMAALAAGRSGARVIIADEDFLLGGRLNAEKVEIKDRDGAQFAAATVAELHAMPNVRVMARTTVFGAYDQTYGALERVSDHLPVPPAHQPRQRLWRITPKRVVLAAGAIDRPIVFEGNDKPGVMLAQSVQTYINRFAAAPATSMAYFISNDGGWTSAFDAQDAGIDVPVLVDARETVAETLALEAKRRGMRVILNGAVTTVHGGTVKSIIVSAGGTRESIACDGLAVSGGFSPNIQIASHHRGRPSYREDIGALVANETPPGMRIAGAAAGSYALSACLADGASAGAKAAEACGFTPAAMPLPTCSDTPHAVKAFWHVAGTEHFAFVDLQTDVSVKDIEIAHKEGFRAVEHLKRYTALGMGLDQGKLANFNGLAIMADKSGRSIDETGTTIYRPPYTPVAMGAFAGHHKAKDFRPTRLTPTHHWAEKQGAKFVETGLWLRAQYFPKADEHDWLESVQREVRAVREGAGMIDVSTFGKIDLQGPDVGKLLDFVYANMFSTLPVGKARYGVMLREDGIVMDDGTTAHLADDRWVMTTTTVNAVKVFAHLEYVLQVLRPDLDVRMASVSEQWAQIALAGPKARDILMRIADRADVVSNEALPVMGACETTVMGGVAARIFRLSFSGELGFEIAVPAHHGELLAETLMLRGKDFGLTPYGTEALAMMRIEKGHVSGPELNGQTTIADLGMGKMASKKKDFIGKVMAARPGMTAEDRLGFVGIRPCMPGTRIRAGAHLIAPGVKADLAADLGYISSATVSPTFGSIGLGFIKGGTAHIGMRIRVFDPLRGGDCEAEICSPHFYDPEGERLRV